MKPEDYQYDVRGHAQNETAAQQRVDVDYEGSSRPQSGAKQGVDGRRRFYIQKILEQRDFAMLKKSGDFAESPEQVDKGGFKNAEHAAVKQSKRSRRFRKHQRARLSRRKQGHCRSRKEADQEKGRLGKDVDNSTGRKIRAEKEQTEKAITDEANKVARSINTSDVAVEWWVRDTSIKLSENIAKKRRK